MMSDRLGEFNVTELKAMVYDMLENAQRLRMNMVHIQKEIQAINLELKRREDEAAKAKEKAHSK